MDKNFFKALLLTAIAVPITAGAEITLRGFASVGGGFFVDDVYDDDDTTSVYREMNSGFESDPFNKFAIQAQAQVNEKTDITGQLIARGVDGYQLEAEWAYVTYHATDSTDIRLGRLRAPFFLYSDFLEVGYSYPWVSPPINVYRLPFSTVEGADLINRHSLGDWDATLQAYYGTLTDSIRFEGEVLELQYDDFWGANYTFGNDWLTLRLAYNRAENYFNTSSSGFLPLYQALCGDVALVDEECPVAAQPGPDLIPGFPSVVDALRINGENADFIEAGFNIDASNFIAAGEYTAIGFEDQTILSEDEAWYVMLGWRFGDFTVHATYVEETDEPDTSVVAPIDALLALDPTNLGLIGLRAATLNAIDFERTNVIVGLRWDYSPSTAFKIEVDSFEITGGGTNPIDLSPEEVDGTLVTFAIDVVF